MYACTCTHTHVRMYTCTHVHIRMYACTHTHVRMYACTHVHIRMYALHIRMYPFFVSGRGSGGDGVSDGGLVVEDVLIGGGDGGWSTARA